MPNSKNQKFRTYYYGSGCFVRLKYPPTKRDPNVQKALKESPTNYFFLFVFSIPFVAILIALIVCFLR